MWTLDFLKEKGVKATFFCVGDNVRKYPDLYRRIIEENHAVGNHTHNHLKGWHNNTQKYVENVVLASEYIDSKLFRLPYGLIKRSQARYLTTDYKIIMWDVLSGNFLQDISPERCYQDVMKKVRPGSILLFHNHKKSEKNMRYTIPRLIDELHKQGYEFDICH